MNQRQAYATAAMCLAVGAMLPFNDATPLLAKAINAASSRTIDIKPVAKSPVQLVLSAERGTTQTIKGKATTQWQVLDRQQAAVVPGNLLRYTLAANNSGTAPVKQFVMTQPVPQRTVFVANSVKLLDNVGANVTYSIDNGKTYSAQPQVKVQGKSQPAPMESYTHLRIQPDRSLTKNGAITAQYQVRVK